MSFKVPDDMPADDVKSIKYFTDLFTTESPTVHDIWSAMDYVWDRMKLDNENVTDLELTAYYNDPVWLLNGLFIEQDYESLQNRKIISEWVVNEKPARIADYGGGFGTLSRIIATQSPSIIIDIIEPNPLSFSLALSKNFKTIQYKSRLEGEYDLILATDVFEHISDPLEEVILTSKHLKVGGKYLIANCFYPVIKCHLPNTFHLRYTWELMLRCMKYKVRDQVGYGRVFEKTGEVRLSNKRLLETVSRIFFMLIEFQRYCMRSLSKFIRNSS